MDRTNDGEIKANQENEKIAREENERLSAIPREFIDSEENFRDVISYLFERQNRFSFGRKQYEDACIFYELPFSPIKDLPEYKSFKEKLNAWKEDLPFVERMKERLQESQLHEMKKTFDNIYRDWVEKTMSVAIPKIYVTNWLFDLSHRHGKELDIESMRSAIGEVIFKNNKLYGQIKEKNENASIKKQEEVEPIKNRIYDLLGIDEQERANFPIPYRCFEITPEEQANIDRLPEDKKDDVSISFIRQELIRRIGKARAERTINDIIKSYSEKSIQRNKLTGEQESEFDNFLDKHRPSVQEQFTINFNKDYEANKSNPDGPENPGGSGAPVRR